MESQFNLLTNQIQIMNDELNTLNAQLSQCHSSKDRLKKENKNSLTLAMHCLCQAMEMIQQFLIHVDVVSIKQSIGKVFNLTNNLSTPFQTIVCQSHLGSALASNTRRLLMDQRSYLQLFDQNLTLIKQYQWRNGFIRDMSWSSVLKNFILITNNQRIYLVNEDMTTIGHIQDLPEEDWSSCTCSDDSLFVTTNDRGTRVFQFNLSPIIQLTHKWQTPHSCQEHELIRDIDYNNQTLAFIIEDSLSNMVHLELRSSKNLHLIWLFRSDISYQIFSSVIRCCSLPYDQWLLIDSNQSRLFHIDSDGQMKDTHVYEYPPWNAISFQSDKLVIRTETSLNFHHIY